MRLTIASLALLCAVGPISAADEKDPKIGWASFLPLAIDDALACQRFSSLADKRASSTKVKEFAKKLEADSETCWKELSKAAEGKKVGILAGLQKGSQARLVRLTSLSGEQFDREYIDAVINKLVSIQAGMKGQEKTDVESIGKFVKDRQKSVDEHLETARKIQKDVGTVERKDS